MNILSAPPARIYPTFGTRCPTCTCTHRLVPGCGPRKARVMSIGERPGQQEEKEGIPFIGPSGREFNENYLSLAGLDRNDIYVTNTVKCGEVANRKPTDKEIASCSAHHLKYEIEMVDPDLILLLGATACSLVPDLSLDIEHGIPRPARIFSWEGIVCPMYHPAAGMHDTGTMIPLLEDFERLGKFLAGDYSHPDPLPQTMRRYQSLTDPYAISHSLAYHSGQTGAVTDAPLFTPYLACDTESHGSDPFSIQFSSKPGEAIMIPYAAAKLMGGTAYRGVIGFLANWQPELIFHHLPADIRLFESLICPYPLPLTRDTMQEAYHLGNLPQGLKALGYRLLGERMRTWEDVVKPHSRKAMREWLTEAVLCAQLDLHVISRKQLKTKVKEEIKPGETERALTRILRYATVEGEYDPWEKLDEHWSKLKDYDIETETRDREHLYDKLGPPPILGIGNVPADEAIQYACQDADITGRVAMKLFELRNRQMPIYQGDCDR